MSELDKLFSDYEERKQKEKEADEKKRLQEKELRDRSIPVLKSVVLPVLKELSLAIQQKGHESAVEVHFENYVFPSVTLTFTPAVKGREGAIYVSASKLVFSHTESGHIEASEERTRAGKQTHYGRVTLKISDMSEEVVRSRALSFIEAVLAN